MKTDTGIKCDGFVKSRQDYSGLRNSKTDLLVEIVEHLLATGAGGPESLSLDKQGRVPSSLRQVR